MALMLIAIAVFLAIPREEKLLRYGVAVYVAALAGAFLIDWLKTEAPFWKREDTDRGSAWVEAREADEAAARRWSRTDGT